MTVLNAWAPLPVVNTGGADRRAAQLVSTSTGASAAEGSVVVALARIVW
ncbi:MAG: hypothetical protein PF961_00815 [Planctomycetota bacterium]|nr:hypothetical protein [Planctomycetota bacterium]